MTMSQIQPLLAVPPAPSLDQASSLSPCFPGSRLAPHCSFCTQQPEDALNPAAIGPHHPLSTTLQCFPPHLEEKPSPIHGLWDSTGFGPSPLRSQDLPLPSPPHYSHTAPAACPGTHQPSPGVPCLQVAAHLTSSPPGFPFVYQIAAVTRHHYLHFIPLRHTYCYYSVQFTYSFHLTAASPNQHVTSMETRTSVCFIPGCALASIVVHKSLQVLDKYLLIKQTNT